MRTWIQGQEAELVKQMHRLVEDQKQNWEHFGKACKELKKIRQKEIILPEYTVILQLNPGRIKSSTAKTDWKSVQNRECFLCEKNLPFGQKGILWEENSLILCNPAPVMENHFTIVQREHIPQEIGPHFKRMLKLATALSGQFTIVYNGPESGASAPDHSHFQAVPSGNLPIEREVMYTKKRKYLKTTLFHLPGDDRTVMVLKGKELFELCSQFKRLLALLRENSSQEPKMNLLSFHKEQELYVVIFLREKHRPGFYFKSGRERIIVSPGSIDMGGIMITLSEEDFRKLSGETIRDIYREVSFPRTRLTALLRQLVDHSPHGRIFF